MLAILGNRLGAVIVFCGLLIAIRSLLGAQLADGANLTSAEIQQAIEFGKTGSPRPYLLRPEGREDNRNVVGLVYTPFVRVALLSQAAAKRGESITLNDVDPDVVKPTVYIAFRWFYCCSPPDPIPFDPLGPPDPEVLALSAGSSTHHPPSAKGQAPVRNHPGSALVSRYGGFEEYDDIALVAEFPMATLKASQSFMISKRYSSGSFRVGIGVVRASDAARWR